MAALDLIRKALLVTGTVEPLSTEPYKIVNGVLVYVAPGTKVLELSDKGIKEIRCRLPAGLKELYLGYNQIEEVRPGVLPAGLKILHLSNNQIRDIRPGVLSDGLKNLDLSSNKITELRPGVLPAGLKTLWLYGNRLTPRSIDALRAKLPRCRIYA